MASVTPRKPGAHDDVTKKCIVYFGNVWHSENRTSSHHIARSLARHHRVLYFECPGLRAPKHSGRDLRKILAVFSRFFRRPVLDQSGVVVRTLIQVPLHNIPGVGALNTLLLVCSVRWAMWRENVTRPIVFFLIPHAAPLLGRLKEALSVYYCIDDYAALPDVDREAVAAMDARLTAGADVVFVAAQTLLPAKRQLNPRTYLSPHGVDFAHFARAQDPDTRIPEDVGASRRPIIGFFGLIEQWIDLDTVAYVARQRPDWTVVMVGRVAVDVSSLEPPANMLFLGWRPYDSLPAYGKAFDVAIIPYKLTRQVINSNPLKLREYLAMGKPIVSVSAPEIDKFAEVIAIARSAAEFLQLIEHQLQTASVPGRAQKQMALAATMGWDRRVDEVLTVVEDELKRKRGPRAAMPRSVASPLRES